VGVGVVMENKSLIKNVIYSIICGFFSIIFLLQTFGEINIFSPTLFLDFVGLSNNFFSMILLIIIFWSIFFILLPFFGIFVLKKIYSDEEKAYDVVDSILNKFFPNAITMFFIVLFGGLSFSFIFNQSIFDSNLDIVSNWILFWFFGLYFVKFLIFNKFVLKLLSVKKVKK
jgi:hypothetical protein